MFEVLFDLAYLHLVLHLRFASIVPCVSELFLELLDVVGFVLDLPFAVLDGPFQL